MKEFWETAEGFGFEVIEATVYEEIVECCENGFSAVGPTPGGNEGVATAKEGADVCVVTMMLDGRIGLEEGIDDCLEDVPYGI